MPTRGSGPSEDRRKHLQTLDPGIDMDRVPRAAVVAVALLSFTAGCTGLGPDASPGGGDAGTTTLDGQTTATGTTTARDVLAFESLSPEARATFETLLEAGRLERRRTAVPPDLTGDGPRGTRLIRHEGTTYEVSWRERQREFTSLGDPERANESAVEPDARVVDYANLSPRGQRLFDQAREEGRSDSVHAGDFPPTLREARYVRYRDDVYRLTKLRASEWWTTLEIDRADSGSGTPPRVPAD